ncbi:hypothetical protein [Clostridium pasteurianum]|uniref:Carrier domain-containing protein n=1 Tax=Clostridium pasteurianum BC1 TaxID=86416 RepID=R4KD29_CLOPA|nr:hypothetical protein [Clostridium pasteurianum]AGK99601.1 hypothetical protein Clopa_4932 [Clostridium pasteurianum BC1]
MKNLSENNSINIALNSIFKSKFNIDLFNCDDEIDINDNLLGNKLKFRARDLIYLIYYIEKEFNIDISINDIDNIKFNTINNIIYIINKKLSENEQDVI